MKRKITIEVDIEPMSEMAARDAGINGASECFNSISRLGECWTYPDGAKIWKPTETLAEAVKKSDWKKNCELKDESFMDLCRSALIFPAVSYIEENKEIKSNPKFDANGHDYVEIAGIKWATMNVGASGVTDYGLYFQWGDTQGYTADQVGRGEGKKKFATDWSDYKFTTDGGKTFTKYNTTGMTLELVDDAVRANWGGSWRMPTKDEFMKLKNAVTTEWTTIDGVNGRLCTDKKDSSKTLFLPACGYAIDGPVYGTGVYGDYWLSSLSTDDVSDAYYLGFDSVSVGVGYDYRYFGQCVRGVLADK